MPSDTNLGNSLDVGEPLHTYACVGADLVVVRDEREEPRNLDEDIVRVRYPVQ